MNELKNELYDELRKDLEDEIRRITREEVAEMLSTCFTLYERKKYHKHLQRKE